MLFVVVALLAVLFVVAAFGILTVFFCVIYIPRANFDRVQDLLTTWSRLLSLARV